MKIIFGKSNDFKTKGGTAATFCSVFSIVA
jgi:hypothetical protein